MRIGRLSKGIAFFVMMLIPSLIVTTFLSALSRYLFRNPSMWYWYLSIWFYGILFSLGGAYVLYLGGHTSVDVFYKRLPNRVKKVLKVVDLTVVLVSCILVFTNAVSQALFSISIWEVDSSVLEISPPIWWYKCILVLAFIILILQSIDLLRETIISKIS
jgi:TRAP-type mannitol/chloroaromatic compound transport system permease small subunit